MFFRILKRDLKRKKTMNFILLLFILLSSMFLASSANNLRAILGAVEHFIEVSNVPDLFVMALSQAGQDEIGDFIKQSKYVASYEIQDSITITDNGQIEILSRKEESADNPKYEQTNTLSVQADNGRFMKVFDENGKELHLKRGEIALTKLEAENNHLQKGDRIAITIGNIRKEYTIAAITKDAVFGTSFMGFKRNIISTEDFEEYKEQEQQVLTKVYCINYKDKEAFQREYKLHKFNVISGVEKSLIPMCYVMDMLMSGILIIVSICLILIAFLVLKFTISFTMQEDYKEIGIMKAIGLKNWDIKKIYMVKYLGLSVVGSFLGFLLSIPFQALMLNQVVVNVVVEAGEQRLPINLAASIFVVAMVLLFCNHCTNRVRKISAIEAIRSGSSGETYHKKGMELSRHKRMRLPLFLACNDVRKQKRQFVVLWLSFILGTMLLLLPLIGATTLESDNIIYSFGVWKSDLYMEDGMENILISMGKDGVAKMQDHMKEIQEVLRQHGIQAQLGTQIGFNYSVYSEEPQDAEICLVMQPVGEWDQHLTMLNGREPENPDEIAITEITAEELKVSIGDSIYLCFQDGDRPYLITGTYQTMLNMGKGIRLSKNAEPDYEYLSGKLAYQIALEQPEQKADAVKVLQECFLDCKIYQGREWIDKMCGLDSIAGQLHTVMMLITMVVLGINALLTVLLVRTFLSRERSDIALMKSMGFQSRTIKEWQLLRILLVLALAILTGTILAHLLAPYTVGEAFGMMGAKKMRLTIDPIKGYLLYPMLLFMVTGCAAWLSTGGIRQIDIREVNNIE